ncbi:MAG TPA: hypothetical protein DEP42_03410 [Ruminococcaceae bacterium]|nr:hypothetical protein [Oscillospiraceae bacterium]
MHQSDPRHTRRRTSKRSVKPKPRRVRHVKKKRRRLTRSGRIVLRGVALILVVVIGIVIFRAAFPVGNVVIEGKVPYTTERILQAGNIKKGDQFFGVNTKQITSRLESLLPYVGEAKASVHFPNTVVIQLTQATPVFAVADGSSYALTDDEGKVLQVVTDLQPYSNVASVAGVSVNSLQPGQSIGAKTMSLYRTAVSILKTLNSAGVKQITSVNVSNQYQISFAYQGRVTVIVGTTADMDTKLQYATYILSKQLSSSDKGTLDVSQTAQNGTTIFTPGQ